jgi:proliferating cell nuclear antigen
MDIDSEHLGIPDTQYDAVVRMASAEFARITRDLANVGDSVKIEVTKDGVSFASEGDIGNAKLTLKQGSGSAAAVADSDDEDDEPKSKKRKGAAGGSSGDSETIPVRIQLQQSVTLTFSLKYLSNFAKATPLCREVALHMAHDVPLLCEFAFDNGHVRYYLAPKLNDDGDE